MEWTLFKGDRLAWIGVSAANLIIFTLISPTFIDNVHHHWIVPAFSGLLAAEAGFIFLFFDVRRDLWLRALSPWFLFVAVILQWRQLSMFQCFRHCEGRLALGLLFLAAGGFFTAKGLERGFLKKTAGLFWRLTLVWMFIILALGIYRGTLPLVDRVFL